MDTWFGRPSCVLRQAQHEGSFTAIDFHANPNLLMLSLSKHAPCWCKSRARPLVLACVVMTVKRGAPFRRSDYKPITKDEAKGEF
jgi:hypothetical protein